MLRNKNNILLTKDIAEILTNRNFSGSYVIVKSRSQSTLKETFRFLAGYSSDININDIISQYEQKLKEINDEKWTPVACGTMIFKQYTGSEKPQITICTVDMLAGRGRSSVLEDALDGCEYSI
jgi:hypothetical protein